MTLLCSRCVTGSRDDPRCRWASFKDRLFVRSRDRAAVPAVPPPAPRSLQGTPVLSHRPNGTDRGPGDKVKAPEDTAVTVTLTLKTGASRKGKSSENWASLDNWDASPAIQESSV